MIHSWAKIYDTAGRFVAACVPDWCRTLYKCHQTASVDKTTATPVSAVSMRIAPSASYATERVTPIPTCSINQHTLEVSASSNARCALLRRLTVQNTVSTSWKRSKTELEFTATCPDSYSAPCYRTTLCPLLLLLLRSRTSLMLLLSPLLLQLPWLARACVGTPLCVQYLTSTTPNSSVVVRSKINLKNGSSICPQPPFV